MRVEPRLSELGLSLPAAPEPAGAYVPAVRTGELLFVSGQLPLEDGELVAKGRVASAVPLERAQAAARQCLLNGLAILKAELGGDFGRLVRLVRLGVFVQSDEDFHAQARAADGASELAQKLLGEAGRHARAAVGVNALPRDAAVEMELLFEVR